MSYHDNEINIEGYFWLSIIATDYQYLRNEIRTTKSVREPRVTPLCCSICEEGDTLACVACVCISFTGPQFKEDRIDARHRDKVSGI